MKKLPPQKVRILVWILFTVGVIVGIVGALTEITLLFVLGIIALFCGAGCHFLFYRCPYCGKFLIETQANFALTVERT